MPRSHPPTLIRLVERCLREECALPRDAGILVAVSGGPDSMALLHVLSLLAPRLGLRLSACGVDHGLRPEAAAELSMAEEAAHRWGVPFHRRAVAVPRGGNLQARAREARYAVLREEARKLGLELIAVAHHQEDRAETVLLRLLRGAGPRGLAVLPARSGDLLRPMIRASRRDVELHLERHRVPFCEDPSNRDPRYLRSRVRHELLPLLTELSPGAVTHLSALADQLCEAQQRRPEVFEDVAAPQVEGVALNREQAAQLRRALEPSTQASPSGAARTRSTSKLCVPLSRERVLVLDSTTRKPRILTQAPTGRGRR